MWTVFLFGGVLLVWSMLSLIGNEHQRQAQMRKLMEAAEAEVEAPASDAPVQLK